MKKNQQQQPSLFDTELPNDVSKAPKNVSEVPVSVSKAAESETKAEIPNDWYLNRWVQFATPQWKKILKESIEAGDKRREAYARKILRDTLGVKDV